MLLGYTYMSDMIYSKSFVAGEEIFRIGDSGRNAYIIEKGEVEISNTQNGEEIVIARLGEGEIFGEMSMIDDAPRSATVRASQITDVIVIQRSRYMSRLHSDNPMMNLIIRVILNRFRETQHLLAGKERPQAGHDHSLDEIRELAFSRINVEKDMRDALEGGEFEMHYQPIISLENGHIAGFEALMRWFRPDGAFVSPGEFIPLAEETGFIVDLGRWALETSLENHKSLMAAFSEAFPGQATPFMSVNVSGLQLSNLAEIDALASIISESGVDPANIKLEITETMMVENFAHATEALKMLQGLGTSIALDDFGTGYSSLSYLHQFPLDTIKIDRTFVVNMDKSTNAQRVVRGIVQLALALETNIVAEGIEEKEQMDDLRNLGCQYGQGFYMSRPLNHGKALEIIQQKTTW
jgi:diguanylate cyclase